MTDRPLKPFTEGDENKIVSLYKEIEKLMEKNFKDPIDQDVLEDYKLPTSIKNKEAKEYFIKTAFDLTYEGDSFDDSYYELIQLKKDLMKIVIN